MILLAAALLFSVYDGGPVPPGIDNLLLLPGRKAPAGMRATRVEPAQLKDFRESRGELLVIRAGQWPRLRPSVSLEGDRDVGFAAATAEPWVDSNGWIFRYARAIEPSKPVVLIYSPEKDATPKRGSTALALAEAAVFGGAYGVPASALADPHTAAQWKFIAGHEGWFTGRVEAPVAVVSENLDPVAEVMNLLVRRNVPFFACAREHGPDRPGAPPPAVFVRVGQPAPSAAEARHIAEWRSAGTTIIERPSVADPNQFASEVRAALGRRRPFRLSNAQQVIGSLVDLPDGRRILHLLNYGIDPIQDVRVDLAKPASRAVLYAPGSEKGVPLDLRHGEIAVPEIGAYAAVLLEN